MATRSTIALEYADGTVDQIYCHWDGYLAHNGKILMEHWQDPFKVQEMMDLGAMSTLGREIGEKHDFDAPDSLISMCNFYGRDRGETDIGAKRFTNFQDYVENHQYEEYEYILRTDGQWYVCDYSEKYVLLSVALEQQSKIDA
jgi:hypothetical protein